ncbi:ferritin-3, chloroplastic [Cryptomeria japonica]|uniref:ferritin-3, chloroplastic n=1 Tax=Cryptomeria japonica TaxID=3369 RepID=UPI0025AC7613|nr:ferritin-3, chloroplastic [Cryptomeria japonica]XP_057823144.1 ferritin-3, chloroplastic [Cryptomeria japonica]XP_057823145.1 ferritin-3, chloroplastic [Cryptomeria japonica]XP_057823146.1 ferritin-3, chloroplastic [Cryptomeria japonica]
MLLRASSAVSTASAAVGSLKQQDGFHNKFAGEKLNVSLAAKMNQGRCAVHHSASNVKAMATQLSNTSLNGVIFEPFTEVQSQLTQISQLYSESLARQRFSDPCEAALNEQINVEYNVSYVYHALFAYFDRDNVALPGFAKYFKEASDEERNHAEMLMKYQNIRGGKVVLQSILMPVMEFDHPHKGDALYAMELALSLEKLTNEKLLNLHSVAQEANDSQMTDYIEGNFLTEQVEAIKQVAEYVSQLRRIGKGHAVWHFDQVLLHGDGGAHAGGAAIA